MCLHFSNAFFGGAIFFIRGTCIFYICGWDYIRRSLFLGGLQYVNHKFIVLPRLKKNLFFFFLDQHCGTKLYSKSYSMAQSSKKLGCQAKITIRDIVFFPGFKVIIIDVTLLK